MKPLNFFEKAETGLRMQYLARLPIKELADRTKQELNIGKTGTKFVLPVGGKFFETPLKGLKGTPLRMPFPVSVLEYEVNEDLELLKKGAFGLATKNPAKKRILIVKDTAEYLEIFCIHSVDEPEAFRVLGSWVTLPGICRIYRKAENKVSDVKPINLLDERRKVVIDNSQMSKEEMLSAGYPSDLVEQIFSPQNAKFLSAIRSLKDNQNLVEVLVKANTPKEYNAVEIDSISKIQVNPFMNLGNTGEISLSQDYQEEISVVLGFIEALNCSNVKIANLDKRQKRKGTKLLPSKDKYQYKVLTIETKSTTGVNSNSEISIEERHSPREHLRRGHIRTQHYKDGIKKIWINSTVVNPGKGARIEKEYLVA